MKALGYIEYIACGFIGDMMLIISFMIFINHVGYFWDY